MSVKCRATAKSTGERCRKSAQAGGVCNDHGAKAPQTIAKHKRELALIEATAMVQRMNIEPMDDVPTQILMLASEARSLTDVLKQQVAALHADQMTSTNKLGDRSISAEIGAYEKQLQHTGQLLIAIAKLGLEDRRTQVAEADLNHLGQAVRQAVFQNDAEPALTFEQANSVLAAIQAALLA